MKNTYTVQAFREDRWWVGAVSECSPGADRSPLGHYTNALSFLELESMARDLIATILDTDEDQFDVDLVERCGPFRA